MEENSVINPFDYGTDAFSDSSLVAACAPGGSCAIQRAMVEKVPHVHGKSEESKDVLMEGMGEVGEYGKEKSCMSWYFPGLLGFRIMDRRDDWQGPMAISSWALVKGPNCQCIKYSCCKMV